MKKELKNYEIVREEVKKVYDGDFSWYNDKYKSGKRRLKFNYLSDKDREKVYNYLKEKGYDVRNYFDYYDRLVVYLEN